MFETSRCIVDASVATKWQLRDEQFLDDADKIVLEFQEARIELRAPDHIRYDVPSAIRKCVRTRRLTNVQARKAVVEVLGLSLSTDANDERVLAALDLTVPFITPCMMDSFVLGLRRRDIHVFMRTIACVEQSTVELPKRFGSRVGALNLISAIPS